MGTETDAPGTGAPAPSAEPEDPLAALLARVTASEARDAEHAKFFQAIGRRLDALEQDIHLLGEDVSRRVTEAVQAETQGFAQKLDELREELSGD